MRKLVGDMRLMVKCCTLYYEEQLNQNQIAAVLEISRPTVSRLLKEAKETGVVKITIENPFNQEFHSLERILERELGLKEVIIVDDKPDSEQQKNEVAFHVAKYLDRSLKDDDIVGVSMGTTIKCIASFAERNMLGNVDFVPLHGGIGQNIYEIHPNQLVMDLARAYNGKFHLLHTPAYIENKVVRETLSREKETEFLFSMMSKVNVAIVGLGSPLVPQSTMMRTGYYESDTVEHLRSIGAVGDMCLQVFDKDGNDRGFEFNEPVFGIKLESLKGISNVIGLIANENKIDAVLGAARGGYIKTLVINYSSASKLEKKIKA